MSFVQKIIIAVFLVILLGASLFLLKDWLFGPTKTSEITREEIISLLRKNEEGLNYIEKYEDFTIEEKTLLTQEDILNGQQGEMFKEVYEGLELEENRYLKVSLINQPGNRGLIAILDLKNKEVPKAYGLILIQSEVQE